MRNRSEERRRCRGKKKKKTTLGRSREVNGQKYITAVRKKEGKNSQRNMILLLHSYVLFYSEAFVIIN